MSCANRPWEKWLQRVIAGMSMLCLLLLVGCGGTTQLTGPSVSIELTTLAFNSAGVQYSTPLITAAGTVSITATVYDPDNAGVTWMLSPLTFGVLTKVTPTSVTYVAPSQFSTSSKVTITATSVSNPNVTQSVVIPSAPVLAAIALLNSNQNNFNVPISDQTLSPGATLQLVSQPQNTGNLNVSWAISPQIGTLTQVQSSNISSATYVAPSSSEVSSPLTVTMTATPEADPAAASSFRITVLPGGGPDIAVIHVNGGPVPGQVYPNAAFINGVTLCNPGTVVCQTVDGLLVDTGSVGLRILQSAIPLLQLPGSVNSVGNTLENCLAFPDGSFLWGPVAQADVYIAGEAASKYTSVGFPLGSLPVQVISSSSNGVPNGCSGANQNLDLTGGIDLNTAQLLGANGILGVGLEPTDCVLAGKNFCDGSLSQAVPDLYYGCLAGVCQPGDAPVLALATQQVTNPVMLMTGADFNSQFGTPGVVLNIPQVSGANNAILGTLQFADGLRNSTIHTLDVSDRLTTVFDGKNFPGFIDSGMNANYFPSSIPECTTNAQYFCPPAAMNLSATNIGATQGKSTIPFEVDNANSLFLTYPGFTAFSGLAGPDTTGTCTGGTGTCTFEWGLPFFYGRPVFTKIDQCIITPTSTACPPLIGAYLAY